MRKNAILIPLLGLLAFGAWSCGGDDGSDASVTVVAEDTQFNPAEITVDADEEVTLALENRDTIEHDLEVEGLSVEVMADGASEGEHGAGAGAADSGVLAIHTTSEATETMTFIARTPGTYAFYCTIPGHRDAGMVGTFTVQ